LTNNPKNAEGRKRLAVGSFAGGHRKKFPAGVYGTFMR
jgi:hypothetical protein